MSERPAGLRAVRDVPAEDQAPERLEDLMVRVAKGDNAAYEAVFTRVSGPVYGLIRRVLRDPAQSEEVSQEVLVTVWRNASRFDENQGSAMAWIMTMAHRRAVDRVRSEPAYDDVSESVEIRLEKEAVRRCLGSLTELQRESVGLAYYGGYTYREVGELLDVPLGTVKTRMRDGLIRLRDCLGVTA